MVIWPKVVFVLSLLFFINLNLELEKQKERETKKQFQNPLLLIFEFFISNATSHYKKKKSSSKVRSESGEKRSSKGRLKRIQIKVPETRSYVLNLYSFILSLSNRECWNPLSAHLWVSHIGERGENKPLYKIRSYSSYHQLVLGWNLLTCKWAKLSSSLLGYPCPFSYNLKINMVSDPELWVSSKLGKDYFLLSFQLALNSKDTLKWGGVLKPIKCPLVSVPHWRKRRE